MNLLSRCLMAVLIAAGLLMAGSVSHAATVLWTLQNVTFDDGATMSGSFKYDATNNIYSDVNIVSTAGPNIAGFTYTAVELNPPPPPADPGGACVGPPTASGFQLVRSNPAIGGFCAAFTSPMGITGGAKIFSIFSFEYDDETMRFIDEGSIVGVVVPLPAAAWVFGPALGLLLGCIKRRRA